MSVIKTNNIKSGNAVKPDEVYFFSSAGSGNQYLPVSSSACKQRLNLNGTGTISIRSSNNTSSVTDMGTGFYRTNLTNANRVADVSYGQAYSWEVNVQHTLGFLDGIVQVAAYDMKHYNAANSANSTDKAVFTNARFGELA